MNGAIRLAVVVIGTALAVRIAWTLIEPLVPVLAVVLAALAMWQLLGWYRGRW
jgi:hypothetical protein